MPTPFAERRSQASCEFLARAPGVCSALAQCETCLVHRPLALPGARGRLAAAIEFAFFVNMSYIIILY